MLKVGDVVRWKALWGAEVRLATVIDISETKVAGDKYGTPVQELPWATVRANNAVVDLANGYWAYGYQIEPVE